MSRLPALCFALLPLLAGCQSLSGTDEDYRPTQRLMGELSVVQGRLMLQPCDGGRQLAVEDAGSLDLLAEAERLSGDGAARLFADLEGEQLSDRLRATRLYRLQAEGHGCREEGFQRMIARASGNEPFWNISISAQGLVLQRPDGDITATDTDEVGYFRLEVHPEGPVRLACESAGGTCVTEWLPW